MTESFINYQTQLLMDVTLFYSNHFQTTFDATSSDFNLMTADLIFQNPNKSNAGAATQTGNSAFYFLL